MYREMMERKIETDFEILTGGGRQKVRNKKVTSSKEKDKTEKILEK